MRDNIRVSVDTVSIDASSVYPLTTVSNWSSKLPSRRILSDIPQDIQLKPPIAASPSHLVAALVRPPVPCRSNTCNYSPFNLILRPSARIFAELLSPHPLDPLGPPSPQPVPLGSVTAPLLPSVIRFRVSPGLATALGNPSRTCHLLQSSDNPLINISFPPSPLFTRSIGTSNE